MEKKDNTAFAWLTEHTREYRVSIGWLAVIEVWISLLGVGYALVMKWMVDAAVAKNSRDFVLGIIGFALLVIGQLVLRIVTRQVAESVRSSMENTLKRNLFSALLHKEYEKVDRVHSEEWMNRMTSDTAVCAGGMTDILPGFLGMLIRLVGALVLIFYLQPGLALILVPGGLVFLLLTLYLRKPLKHYHKEVQEKDGKVRVYLQERISSMLVLRTFGMEESAASGAEDVMQEHKKARMRKAVVSNVCNSGFSLAINGMYLLGIAYCGYGILADNISLGTLTAIIQLIGQLQSPLSGLSGYVPRFYAMTASAERLMEVEGYPQADTSKVLSRDEAKQFYEEKLERIVLDQVTFSYGSGGDAGDMTIPVLDRVSFAINKGDYVAITGTSGCGKSTMLKVLMGIYEPASGSAVAKWKNVGSVKDSGKMELSDLRRLFGYVPQGNFLMSGTIRDVITFGQEVDHERLRSAIHLACADFIYELPDRIDTVLGEKGTGLSEGQMQRIAIARALYADCPVLILDESTSALDQQTECQLLEHLKKLTDKTVLIVTHRPKVLEICNKQLVFTEGGVQERKDEENE